MFDLETIDITILLNMETKITFNPLDKTDVQFNLEIMEFLASKCGVETSESKVRGLESTICQQNEKINELTNELAKINSELNCVKEEKKKLTEDASKLDEKNAEILKLKEDLKTQNDKFTSEIDEYKRMKVRSEESTNQIKKNLNDRIHELNVENEALKKKNASILREKDMLFDQVKAYNIVSAKDKKMYAVKNGELQETVDEDAAFYLATIGDDNNCSFSFNIDGKRRTGIKERSTYLEPFCDILEAADNPSRIILVASGLAKAEGATLQVIEQAKIKLV